MSVDGGTAASVDLYSSTTRWQQPVWHTPWLATGTHTVTISWTGTKSSGATDANVSVDSFLVVGKVLPASPPLSKLSPEQLAGQRVIYSYAGAESARSGCCRRSRRGRRRE